MTTLLACALGVTAIAEQQTPPENDVIARAALIEFIPESVACAPDLFDQVQARLDAFTLDDVIAMLASDDPHARGIGIFLVDSRCLPELLGPNAQLFDDERPTVDTAFPDAVNQVQRHPSTVAQRYKEAWSTWFVARVRSSDEIRRMQADGELDPWSTYHAWSSLVRRSGGFSAERIAQMKHDIAALPDDLRWLVAVGAWTYEEGRQVFTENEIRVVVLSIDQQTQAAILNGNPPLPPDFVARWGEGNSILHDRARAILKGEPILQPELPEEFKKLRERTGVNNP